MIHSNSIRYGLLLLMAGLFFSQAVQAQIPSQQPAQPGQQEALEPLPPAEISDEDLVAFLEASDAVQPVQQEARERIEQVIRNHDMSVERFAEIARVINTPRASQANITGEEEQVMTRMEEELEEIEIETRREIVMTMAEKGLEVEKYHRIYLSLQQYPELRERIEPLLEQNDNS